MNCYDAQQTEQALAFYRQCIDTDPTFALGHNSLAMAYIDMERYEEAIPALFRSIECDPGYGEAYNNLGYVLRRMGRDLEAAASYTKFLELEPDIEEGPRIRGWLQTVIDANHLTSIPPLQLPVLSADPAPAAAPEPAFTAELPPAPLADASPASPASVEPPPDAIILSLAEHEQLHLRAAAPAQAPAPAPLPAAAPKVDALPKIKKMSAWEAAAGDVATAAPVSALGEVGAAPPAPAAPPPVAPAAPAPQKIKKMSAWEAAAGDVSTAAPVSALGEVGSPAAAAPPAVAAPPPTPAPPAPPAPAAQPKAPPPPPPQAGGAPVSADVVPLVEQGLDQFAEGNFTESASLFQKAIDQDPGSAEAHVGLAKVWIRQDKLNEATELLQKAVQLDPNDPAAFYVLGYVLRKLERNVEAADAYEAYMRLMPDALDTAKMKDWLAQVKSVSGSPAAIPEGEETVADDEQIVTELDKKYQKALAKFQDGDIDTALRDAIRILNEDAGHIRTRVLVGRAYLRQKQYDSAAEQFDAALVTRPDYPEALYFLGQASEKKGNTEKALASYKRYLEVAPGGPRADRLQDWIITHGTPEARPVSGKQAQCELCLRFFAENEVVQHEGRATCRNCLAVMGGEAPLAIPESPVTPPPSRRTQVAAVAELAGKPKRRTGVVLLGSIAALAAIGAGLFYLHLLDPLLLKYGLLKPPKKNTVVVKKDVPDVPVDVGPKFDKSTVKIGGEFKPLAAPFARWTFTPTLEGIDVLDKIDPKWRREFSLKDEPKGMTINPATGQIDWVPEFDVDTLKRGKACKVTLTAKGRKEKDGPESEFFSLTRDLTVGCQFGYEMGPEIDMGLAPNSRCELVSADFTGDGLCDLVLRTGSFREGALQLYVQRRDNPLPSPIPLGGKTFFSAMQIADFDKDNADDLLVADWLHGRVRLFHQKQQELTPEKVEIPVSPGPVALGIGVFGADKRSTVAVLSGPTNTLDVFTLAADGTPGEVSHVPLPVGGGSGFIYPWVSAGAGPGFLVVLPLAEAPLQFVPFNQGNWKASTPVASSFGEGELITAAAPMKSAGGGMRLALLVSGSLNRLQIYDEAGGKFTKSGSPVMLSSLGVGLLARDLNRDGTDDLVVVTQEDTILFFMRDKELVPGPSFSSKKPRMLGPIAVFGALAAPLPELLLINENRKAQILKPVISDPTIVPEYDIKFSRAGAVGSKYQLTATVSDQTTMKDKDGKPMETPPLTRVELSGVVEVLEVDAKGAESKVSCTIAQCTRTVNERKTELIAAGKVIVAETAGGKLVFKIKDAPLPAELQASLGRVLGAIKDEGGDDIMFGTSSRQKEGATWNVTSEAMAADLNKRGGMTVKAEDVSGTVSVTGTGKVDDIDCMNISGEVLVKQFTAPVPPGMDLKSAELKAVFTRALPVNPTLKAAAETGTRKQHRVLAGKQSGAKAFDEERETSYEVKRVPVKQ
jgi:tetratricopeptide (TPR) repeat protein